MWRTPSALPSRRRLRPPTDCLPPPVAATPPPPPGLNLVLISRTESKLRDCAAELEGRYGVQARTVPADLCKAGPDTFAQIAAALEGLDVRFSAAWPLRRFACAGAARLGCCQRCCGMWHVWACAAPAPSASACATLPTPPLPAPTCMPTAQVGVLVNNAGLSYDHPEYLDEVEGGLVADILTINALVPAMVRCGGRAGGGAGSGCGWAVVVQRLGGCVLLRGRGCGGATTGSNSPPFPPFPPPIHPPAALQAGAGGHAGAAARRDHQRGQRVLHRHPRLPPAVGCAAEGAGSRRCLCRRPLQERRRGTAGRCTVHAACTVPTWWP